MKRSALVLASLFTLVTMVPPPGQVGRAASPTLQTQEGCKLVCNDGVCVLVCD